ncbi:phenylalanine--tRNA ligase subunit alpha [Thermosulfurimonas sp. F29]|uniref:phenylalanine--tRNA ligase subunit alpha n=1 Tax=Thermosulfurimonas sp. F29 TaxID=2867247 RepID=UPI001C834568|nr:phenylalanine--tRNA ligase subunit alpha [Thermosulfurimonas sp. F29]MBX6423565.1 phenylalanine--tRNA ligase subunit alpha [Thermosulfurimonas sp. F29]
MTEKELEELRSRALEELSGARDLKVLEELRVRYLGKRGLLTSILKTLKDLPPELRRTIGRRANEIKAELEGLVRQRREALLRAAEDEAPGVDLTLPGRPYELGRLHPITQVLQEICAIFLRLGFSVARGPEVETDYYNFEALNIPPDHPAREMQDTFYFPEGFLLRTHTSPIQIRTMLSRKPPLRIIAPGKVYRCDSDVRHTPMFHQVEGLLVDREVSFADLKGLLTYFAREIFGADTRVRFRPSYFPFTEPSAEMDIECVICKGGGCRLCGETGWLEILGAGMVHPHVFRAVGYDTEKWRGFAFGLGVERIAMLKFGIDDIRLFYENHLRFLEQF